MSDTVAVVTPIGNERCVLPQLLAEMRAMEQQLSSKFGARLLWLPVFDSYCTDGGKNLLAEWSDELSFMHVIDVGDARGIAYAYLAGYAAALGHCADYVIEADVGHPIGLVPEMRRLLVDYDAVFGNRYWRHGFKDVLFYRRWLSWWGTFLARRMLGIRCKDATSGFQGFRAAVVRGFLKREFLSRGHMFQTELKNLCKQLSYVDLDFVYSGGESSLKFKAVLEAIKTLFRLRHAKPLLSNEVR